MDTERQLCWNPSLATLGVTSILILQMRTQVWAGHFLPEVTHQAKWKIRQGLWKFKEARQHLGGGQRSEQGLRKTLSWGRAGGSQKVWRDAERQTRKKTRTGHRVGQELGKIKGSQVESGEVRSR